MSGYSTRLLTVHLGEHDYRIRALSDRQQFADPFGLAERIGISSAQWCLFGQVWPAGRLLAEAMSRIDIAGKRILEIGCGLGLASLVLQRRHADITASDHHPLAEPFLQHNAALNQLPALVYHDLPWAGVDRTLDRFDLIIGSDILYERNHAELLAALVYRHGCASGEVLITDPGRGNSAGFTRALELLGYRQSEQRAALDADDRPPYRGQLLRYQRSTAAAPGSH